MRKSALGRLGMRSVFWCASVLAAGVFGANCNSSGGANELAFGDGSAGSLAGSGGMGGLAGDAARDATSGDTSTNGGAGGREGTTDGSIDTDATDRDASGSGGNGGAISQADSGNVDAGRGGAEAGTDGSLGTGGTTSSFDGGGDGSSVASEVAALCSKSCEASVSLTCHSATKCAGVCWEWFRDSSEPCIALFADYLRCAAPRPASDFTCGCCGWVLPNSAICKAEREAYEKCLNVSLQ